MTEHRMASEIGPGRRNKSAYSFRCSCGGFTLYTEDLRDGTMAAQIHLDNHPTPTEDTA